LNNGHYYPIAYFLLPDKKFESYQKAFNGLIERCSTFNFNFKPDLIFVDFETSIHKAIRLTWPLATIKGCRFYLGQSSWRKIQSLGLSTDYKDKESDIGEFKIQSILSMYLNTFYTFYLFYNNLRISTYFIL